MKTTPFLLLFSAFVSYAQNPTTAIEYIEIGAESDIVSTQIFDTPTSRSEEETLTFFPDLQDFFSNCSNGEFLTFEGFEGGPANPSAGVMGCESIISAAGGECFPAGEIQENVEFTNSFANGGGTMIFFDGTTFGINNPGVGANSFAAFTIVNFTGDAPVTSVGFNLHSPLGDGGLIQMRVFGENDLLETVSFDVTNAPFFVGFVSESPIVSIELENLKGVIVELVTQFYFGSCEVLSTADTILNDLSFYPNPTQGVLHITSQRSIETVAIFNLLGQRVATHTINSLNPRIDVQNLTSGAYIIEVLANGQKSTHKLIKE